MLLSKIVTFGRMTSIGDIGVIWVMWRLEHYSPLPTEFATLESWRAAVRNRERALRLSKLSSAVSNPEGHYVAVRAFKIPLDEAIDTRCKCACCGREILNQPVGVGSYVFHQKCLPGTVTPGIAEDLMLFGDELELIRPFTTFLGLVR